MVVETGVLRVAMLDGLEQARGPAHSSTPCAGRRMHHSRPSCRSTARRRKCISEEATPCSKMHGSSGKDVRMADIARGCQVDAASATPKINLTLRAWRCRGDDWATPPFRLADCAPFNVLGVYARRSHDLASLRLLPSRPLNSSLVAVRALSALLCLCLPPAHVAFRSPTVLASSAPPGPPAPPPSARAPSPLA
jgi:hypothetical protein